ncbi:MAG: hypothetical protein FWF44_07470, partial [Defluviitaleaceae bacterium]|nr:hypothetical protein [Defluviitaleaceae bacterium]
MTQKPTENGRGAPAKTAQAQGGEASNWEGFKGTEILHADSLSKLKAFPDGVFGGVITDPPYSSGAFSISSKQADTSKKYSSIKSDNKNVSFMGDGKDQRSWTRWMAEILSEAYRASKDGAAICAFTDWRQLPAMTDALQWAGWHWRGVVVWNKTNSRPQKGRFRQDAEFVVWGSKGNLPVDRAVPILPGVFDIAAPAYS